MENKKRLYPQSISPPETIRDEFTGKYTTTKKEATQTWFRNARKIAIENTIETRSIDPKQAISAQPKKKKK